MQPSYLPESYVTSLRDLLGEEMDAYLESFSRPPVESLRFHIGKWSPEEAQEIFPEYNKKVPWCEAGRYIPDGCRPSRDPAYFAGLWYIQEASAMSSGDILPLAAGDKVLDLCAAPGGKATQLAARMRGGVLFANDISPSRAKFLAMNLDRAGVTDCFVTAESPEKLAEHFPAYFQAVLADAPCSGEGMMHRDPHICRDWVEKGPSWYAPLQAEILDQAAALTAPGGHLLYSTCTFSRMENEGNIESFLQRHSDFSLQTIPMRPGFSEGFLPGTVRIWPQRAPGEGHFLALLRKSGEPVPAPQTKRTKENLRKAARAAFEIPYLRSFTEITDGRRLLQRENCWYAVPEDVPVPASLHYLRTGLLLGEENKGRFKPSQALAMALDGRTYPDTVSFDWKDPQVLRYLKGETVDAGRADIRGGEGLSLVCVDRFPLGWTVRTGTKLKNKLHPAWRYQ